MKRQELSIASVVTVYALGLAAGVQLALYAYDRSDDGVADTRSGLIGTAFVAIGVVAIAYLFRSRARAK